MSGNFEMARARSFLEEEFCGRMQDEEMDELIQDLCRYGRHETIGEVGPLMALEFYKAGDWGEEVYREAVERFKKKWIHRTPRNRIEFYQNKLQGYCDVLKAEMEGTRRDDE